MKARSIFAFALGPIGVAVLSLITLPVTAWFFSADSIGKIAFLTIFLGFSNMLFSLGLDQAYVREYFESDDKPELWKTTVLPGLGLMFFVFLFLLILNPFFLSKYLFDIESISISLLIILVCVSNYFIRFFSLILRMQGKGLLYSMSQIWPKVLNIIFLLTFVLFLKKNEFIYLLFAQALAIVTACLIFAWNTKDVWLKIKNIKINIYTLNPLIRFGFPLMFGGLAYWGLTSIDRIFLKSFSNFEELGIYSMAISFAGVAVILQNIFSTVWAPIIFKWVSENKNLEKIYNISWQITIIIVFIFSGVGLFSSFILYILPEKYYIVQYIILPAIAAPLLYTLSETTVIGISISKKSFLSLFASLGGVLCGIVLNYILTPKYGALGACISTSLAFMFFFILRTELSVLAWRSFPRFKMYFILIFLIGLAIINAVTQDKYIFLFKLIWLSIFALSSFYVFKIFKSLNLFNKTNV